jgi:hypothetical protein
MLSGECSLTIVPPTTIDNCSGTITGTTTQPLVYTTQTSGVIHWTFDDLNGNVSYADQVFYIDDIIPPFVSDCPQNMIACENQPVYFNAPNGSDNCSASIVIEQIEGPVSGTIFPLGTTTVAFSLTDEEGNVSYCSFQVTVQQAPDASVSQSGFTLTANLPNANYQWIDCGNNFEPIVGETFQSYNVTANGSYAVVVSNGICSDTSACIEITTVSIITPEEGITLTVYPNPVKDNVTIKTTEPADFNIMDMNEKVVYSGRVENTLTINLNYLANGIYTLRTANGTIRRLVKQ